MRREVLCDAGGRTLLCVCSIGFKWKLDSKQKLLSVYVFLLIYLEKTDCSFPISWKYKVCFWSLPSLFFIRVYYYGCKFTELNHKDLFPNIFQVCKISFSFTFCHHHKIVKVFHFYLYLVRPFISMAILIVLLQWLCNWKAVWAKWQKSQGTIYLSGR